MNLDLLKKTKLNEMPGRGNRKRGSTVLLVLAMLTILLLLGIAFSYSTRLETQASNNYAELAQARTSAVSGLPMAVPMILEAAQGLTSTLQDWQTVPQSLEKMVKANGKTNQLSVTELAAVRNAGISVSQNKSGELQEAPQANITVRDLSGLVNINAIPDQTAMERVVSAVLPGGNIRVKSTALLALRGDYLESLDKATRTHSAETERENIDVRDPSARILDNLSRLRYGQNNGKAAFTETEIEKLSDFVTVFSQTPEVYNGENDSHIPRIPLDSIEPRKVFEILTQAFPQKKPELLLQFSANLIDFSDADNEPTILDGNGNPVSYESLASTVSPASDVTIGVEMTPFISEVYPDAATSIGFDDDGQFVEIVNPWNKSISLSGWTLRTGQGSVILNTTLPANGYLVVTDNYDSPKPDSPPGHGSIVSLFGATANGESKQVQVDPGLNLPDRSSRVSLYDPSGNLVDVFIYGSTPVDGKMSFQRPDPLVRGSIKADASPFAASTAGTVNTQMISAVTKAWDEGNTTMTKLSQLFTISTGFVEKNAEVGTVDSLGKVHAGQLADLSPLTAASANTQVDEQFPDNLDLRLIDIFTASSLDLPDDDEDDSELASRNGADAYKAFQDKMNRLRKRSKAQGTDETETTVTTAFSYGKLNINTCSKYALLGLDLDSVLGKQGVAGMIEQFEGHRLTRARQSKIPFQNVSDFVSKFVTNLSLQNLNVLDTVTDQVAVGSSSFEITSTNRLSSKQQAALESKDGSNGSRPATATARWVVSTDKQPYTVVDFSLVP